MVSLTKQKSKPTFKNEKLLHKIQISSSCDRVGALQAVGHDAANAADWVTTAPLVTGLPRGRKGESEKVGLKLNIQKTKIMPSSPITSWEIDGETVSDFIFGGSKITADGDCSHEIKRRLLLGRKVMTNLVQKQRHYFAD